MNARALVERMTAPVEEPKPAPAPSKPAPSRPAAPPAPSRPASPWRKPGIRPGTEPKPKAEKDDEVPEPPVAEVGTPRQPLRVNPPYA